MNVIPKGSILQKLGVGSELPVERLFNMVCKDTQKLVINSIPGILTLPFEFHPVYGKIMDSDVSIKFTAMGQDTSVWDNNIYQALNNQNILDSLYDSM